MLTVVTSILLIDVLNRKEIFASSFNTNIFKTPYESHCLLVVTVYLKN